MTDEQYLIYKSSNVYDVRIYSMTNFYDRKDLKICRSDIVHRS